MKAINMKSTVINKNGDKINFKTALMCMDEETCDEVADMRYYETEQDFFTAYEKLHAEKFVTWELSKQNPVY